MASASGDACADSVREHHELLHDVELPQRAGHGPLAGRQSRRGLAPRPRRPRSLVSAVRRRLDEAEVPDVSGQRGLGHLDAPTVQPLAQLLLAGDGLSIDQLEHE